MEMNFFIVSAVLSLGLEAFFAVKLSVYFTINAQKKPPLKILNRNCGASKKWYFCFPYRSVAHPCANSRALHHPWLRFAGTETPLFAQGSVK
jgi:hypothetical protein